MLNYFLTSINGTVMKLNLQSRENSIVQFNWLRSEFLFGSDQLCVEYIGRNDEEKISSTQTINTTNHRNARTPYAYVYNKIDNQRQTSNRLATNCSAFTV